MFLQILKKAFNVFSKILENAFTAENTYYKCV